MQAQIETMKVTFLKNIVFVLLLSMLGTSVFAQADVDSPYSLFGVGQLRDKSMNVRLKGMGGVSYAMFDGGMINTVNPASYAKIDSLSFLFDAGVYFKTSTFSTSVLSEPSANASFDYLAMAFGVFPWWKMSLGVMPYSTKRYTMIVDGDNPALGSYATSFKGLGGLNQAFWGNAFKIGKHVAVGANVYYVFGDSETETTLYFPDSLYMLATRRSVDLMIKSFMFDYGVLCDFNVGSDMNLSFGLTYSQSVKLKGNQLLFIRSIEEDQNTGSEYLIDTIVLSKCGTYLTMPQGIGGGFVLRKDNRWSIGADFNWTQWSKFAREDTNDQLQDSWSVAVGAEFFPRHTSVSNYFTKASYRLGGFYEQSYLNLDGNSLSKVGVSAGVSLPLPRSLSKVNLAFEVGQFGTQKDNLILERYVKLNVGVSVHERWFVKRKYK